MHHAQTIRASTANSIFSAIKTSHRTRDVCPIEKALGTPHRALRTCAWTTKPAAHSGERANLGTWHLTFARALSGEVSAKPGDTKRLLLVYHSRTGLAERMSEDLARGAQSAAREMLRGEDGDGTRLRLLRKRARDASHEDLLRCDGLLLCAPENLASVSGEMLEFFHSNYYHCFEASDSEGAYDERSLLLGRPVGIAVAAGSDGSSAAAQMERICLGWRLKQVAPSVIVRNGLVQTKANILKSPKECPPEGVEKCEELGALVAATILL